MIWCVAVHVDIAIVVVVICICWLVFLGFRFVLVFHCDYFVYAQNNCVQLEKLATRKMGGMLMKCENNKNRRFSKCIIIFVLSLRPETISARHSNCFQFDREQKQK